MRLLPSTAAALLVTLSAGSAAAQLHWDTGAAVGVQKRFLASGAADAGFGPTAQLQAHVALLPLVRVGGYLGYEISPLDGDRAARDMFGGGLRVKIMSPWPRGDVRLWLFVGFGLQAMYARSYRTTVLAEVTPGNPAGGVAPREALVGGSGGRFLEVPFGIGVSYKFRKPFELFGELGSRVGFAGSGSAYDLGPSLSVAGRPDTNAPVAGQDRFSLGLSLGLLIDL
ncbi:MAG: hypothetical protein JST00_37285 [Deltaproteobacteria bacterium]|nr:hypothetical protein [Deltaproteobacteria bacterium]